MRGRLAAILISNSGLDSSADCRTRVAATKKGTRDYYVVRAVNAIRPSLASNEATAIAK